MCYTTIVIFTGTKMEDIWASVQNVSDELWSSVEAMWSKDTTWASSSDGQSQWDNFIYFINAVSCPLSIALSLLHSYS